MGNQQLFKEIIMRPRFALLLLSLLAFLMGGCGRNSAENASTAPSDPKAAAAAAQQGVAADANAAQSRAAAEAAGKAAVEAAAPKPPPSSQ
jgi:Na+-transporting methylmalonyl-CoA/oxaloacetate decarboxylase gamma subunit